MSNKCNIYIYIFEEVEYTYYIPIVFSHRSVETWFVRAVPLKWLKGQNIKMMLMHLYV